jgi:hypothetical protein
VIVAGSDPEVLICLYGPRVSVRTRLPVPPD